MQEQVATSGSGLTAFKARLINLIGSNEGISQLTLASFTERDKAQIARAIKELEAHGFVTRSAHASDWRTQCLALTTEGKEIHAKLNNLRKELAAAAEGHTENTGLFRKVALVEGVTTLARFLVAMPLKYLANWPLFVPPVGRLDSRRRVHRLCRHHDRGLFRPP